MRIAQILILTFILSFSLSAQITVSHPLNNAVYQRNSLSQANLFISGTYNQAIATSVQAQLINTNTSLVEPGFDWVVITSNPSRGVFQGQLNNVPAGWYELNLRVMKSGSVLESATLNRVGIGDVFMVAGQSNAQGYINNGGYGLGAISEKVISHNNGMYCSNEDIPFPVLNKISETTKLGTAGRDAWCYGRLGDKIVDTTGFPVAIYNSGASGASSENWKVSSDGGATNNIFSGQQFCADEEIGANIGMPYSNFKRGLNLYNSLFGARAILWHQGESDAYIGNISSATYKSNLNYVISKSRTDFAPNLPWVLARVSYINSTVDNNIITAQTQMFNPSNQIFLGPNTDVFFNSASLPYPRDNLDLHFTNPTGLILLADAWSNYLNNSFFSTSNPILPNTPPTISTTLLNNNQITLSVPVGYSSYKWIRTDKSGNSNFGNTSEGNGNSITKSSGTYRCWVATANGNQQISSEVNVEQLLSLTYNGTSCSVNAYLSELKFSSASNGIGSIEINKTNGGSGDGDGVAIVLKAVSYPKGLGVSPNSEIVYHIPSGQYYKFRSFIGIADDVSNACNNSGGVIFKVYGDQTLLYTSPTIYRNSALEEVNVNIFTYSSIKLVVEQVGADATCNRAVWADARILCSLGDDEDPSPPSNLVTTSVLTKCISYSWTPATDNQAVAGYYVYLNGFAIDTLSGSQNSYSITGKSPGDYLNFGVMAFDVVNNKSTLISLNTQTLSMAVEYLGGPLEYPFCVSRSYLPSLIRPTGGIFSIVEGPTATIGANSGEFFSNNIGLFLINYKVGSGVPACEYSANFYLATTSPPSVTPTIVSDKSIINLGSKVTFTSSTTCDANSSLVWSFTGSANSVISYSPTASNVYYASCKKDQCYVFSNNITVKVLPNCSDGLVLDPTVDNLANNSDPLRFNSSGTINATNTIAPNNNIQYNAAKSIVLSPGFKVDSGVIFSAKIQNCPN